MKVEKTSDDVLRLSSVPFRVRTKIDIVYDVLIILSATALCVEIGLADLPFIDQLIFGGVVMWLAMHSVIPEVVIINKRDKTLTRERRLLDRWDVTKQTLSLAEYYGVRVRSADGGNVTLLVELVGKYGAVMTLNTLNDINEARLFRTIVADFLQFTVVTDPTNPNVS